MAKIDWIKIKNEYVNTQTSYRKLAEKYNIPLITLSKKARKEKWVDLHKERYDKTSTKVLQKTAEKIIEANVSYAEKLIKISEKLVDALDKAVEQLEIEVVEGEAVKTGVVNTYRLRQITQSAKDVKEMMLNDADEEKTDMGVVMLPDVNENDGALPE